MENFCDIVRPLKAKTKTRVPVRILREGLIWCESSERVGYDTTSEPSVGNGRSGAPVIVPMSDGYGRNQGGTVEYESYPTPVFAGGGLFLYLPRPTGMLNAECGMQNE